MAGKEEVKDKEAAGEVRGQEKKKMEGKEK